MGEGKTIRVLLAKPGLDGHDRGAKVIARALRDAGMEVIYTGLRQTPEQIIGAAEQEAVDVLMLSILSGAHNYLFPRIMEGLKKKGIDDILVMVAAPLDLLTGGEVLYRLDLVPEGHRMLEVQLRLPVGVDRLRGMVLGNRRLDRGERDLVRIRDLPAGGDLFGPAALDRIDGLGMNVLSGPAVHHDDGIVAAIYDVGVQDVLEGLAGIVA